jgi:hypothetical protein
MFGLIGTERHKLCHNLCHKVITGPAGTGTMTTDPALARDLLHLNEELPLLTPHRGAGVATRRVPSP